MRIAATRSFRIYGLEGPNPKFRLVSIRFESRSTEVDRGRDSVWAISRRPEACRSSESHQNAGFFMLYPVEVVAGLSSGIIMNVLAEEGSTFEDFVQETSLEISIVPAQ